MHLLQAGGLPIATGSGSNVGDVGFAWVSRSGSSAFIASQVYESMAGIAWCLRSQSTWQWSQGLRNWAFLTTFGLGPDHSPSPDSSPHGQFVPAGLPRQGITPMRKKHSHVPKVNSPHRTRIVWILCGTLLEKLGQMDG